MVACLQMLKDHFGSVSVFGGLIFICISNVCTFEATHFWINVLRADDVVTELASRFVFEFCWIRRKLTMRVMMVSR